MQLTKQLSDEELTDVLLEADEKFLRQRFSSVPEVLRRACERPESSWQRQRAEIRSRVASVRAASLRLFEAGAVVFALVLLSFLLLSRPAQPVPSQADADQDLMLAVERAVDSDGPEALAPAMLLANEISQSAEVNNKSQRNHSGDAR